MNSSEDLWERWWALPPPSIKRLEDSGNNWSSLSPQDQELAALWKLEADCLNGGLLQFYCNWGDEVCGFAIRGLLKMGDNPSADLLAECQSLMKIAYERSQKPKEQHLEYWDLPTFLEEPETLRIFQWSEKFCSESRRLSRAELGIHCYQGE